MNRKVKRKISNPTNVMVHYGSPGKRGVINSGEDKMGQKPS